jgi:hypothetical protein
MPAPEDIGRPLMAESADKATKSLKKTPGAKAGPCLDPGKQCIAISRSVARILDTRIFGRDPYEGLECDSNDGDASCEIVIRCVPAELEVFCHLAAPFRTEEVGGFPS